MAPDPLPVGLRALRRIIEALTNDNQGTFCDGLRAAIRQNEIDIKDTYEANDWKALAIVADDRVFLGRAKDEVCPLVPRVKPVL